MYYIVAVVSILVITFLPRVGAIAIYKSYRAAKEREQVEDALKHLLDRENQGRHATPESIGGTLDLPRTKVMQLVETMETQGN